MNEEWRPVIGFEGTYEVSNFGTVRSFTRRIITSHGIDGVWRGRKLKPATTRQGYKLVTLCNQSKQKTKKVHRLVAEAFIPNTRRLPDVNHKNHLTGDNRVENLEWCDNAYNVDYSARADRRGKKLVESDVVAIRKSCGDGGNTAYVAAEFGISSNMVRRIITRKSWNHVP